MITNLGLGIVVVAWLFQLYTSINEGDVLSSPFVVVYAIGVIFLVIDGFSSGLSTLAYLNLVTLLVSMAVLLAVMAKKNS